MRSVSAEELLQSKGVKPTPQRVVITQYLLNTDCHPTADQVLEAVSSMLPVKLSRATVYNTLNALVASGVIQEVFTEPGRARYDANVSDHHHFVDIKSGKIFDIPGHLIPELKAALGNQFRVYNYQVTFYGEAESS